MVEGSLQHRAYQRESVIAHRCVARVVQIARFVLQQHEAPARRVRRGAVCTAGSKGTRTGDQVVERLRSVRIARLQVVRNLGAEFRESDGSVEVPARLEQPGWQTHVDDLGARVAERFQCCLHEPVHFPVRAHEVACHADARAVERVDVEKGGVVGRNVFCCRGGGGICVVDGGQHVQGQRKVLDRTRHRPGRVEGQRQRDDAVPAQQAQSRLETDDPVRR